MKKIVFSLPVHEKAEIIIDTILNIQYFNPDSAIILHVSPVFPENTGWLTEKQFYDVIGKMDDVYVNSEHIQTGWQGTGVSGLVSVHLSNFSYAEKAIKDFEYFVMEASNDLYIKSGLYEKLSSYDWGTSHLRPVNLDTDWIQGKNALLDCRLKNIMDELGATQIYGSQIEGSFFRKKLFKKMAVILEAYASCEEIVKYAYEEVYFATVALAVIQGGDYKGYYGTLVKVFWDKCEYLPNVAELQELEEQKDVFGVKRIPRNYYFLTREYIRSKHEKYLAEQKGVYSVWASIYTTQKMQQNIQMLFDMMAEKKYNETIYAMLIMCDTYDQEKLEGMKSAIKDLFRYSMLMYEIGEDRSRLRVVIDVLLSLMTAMSYGTSTLAFVEFLTESAKCACKYDFDMSSQYKDLILELGKMVASRWEEGGNLIEAHYILDNIAGLIVGQDETYYLLRARIARKLGRTNEALNYYKHAINYC